MTTPEEQIIVVTAFIAALVEGVRLFGSDGAPEDALYASVARMADRSAFDMVVAELVAQKTVRREHGRVVYCGPCTLSRNDDERLG